MKLQTSIKPRRDGVVNLVSASGTRYVFAPDAQGDLCAEIEDAADLVHLMTLGDFFPADVADNEAAMALLKSAAAPDPDGDDDDDQDQDDDDLDDDPVNMDAPPVELPAAAAAPAPVEIPAAAAPAVPAAPTRRKARA